MLVHMFEPRPAAVLDEEPMPFFRYENRTGRVIRNA